MVVVVAAVALAELRARLDLRVEAVRARLAAKDYYGRTICPPRHTSLWALRGLLELVDHPHLAHQAARVAIPP